jgi:hypothetical protein
MQLVLIRNHRTRDPKCRNSSVGIATGFFLDIRSSITGKGKTFLFFTTSRQALEPIHRIRGFFARSEAEHSPRPSTEVKKGRAIPPLPHMFSWHSAYLCIGTTLRLPEIQTVPKGSWIFLIVFPERPLLPTKKPPN